MTSVIRDPAHASDITALSATPHVLSLEDAPVSALTSLFTHAKIVYFAAGAGGKGGPERTRAVDYEGAVKVFDAVEQMEGERPRVILVSALDVRDPDRLDEYPPHYVSTACQNFLLHADARSRRRKTKHAPRGVMPPSGRTTSGSTKPTRTLLHAPSSRGRSCGQEH